MSISSALPTDSQNYKFAGPAGKLPAGRQVGSSDYALTQVEGPDAHDAAATPGYPVQVGGVAESTTPAAVADGDAVRAFFDTLGQLAVRLRGSAGADLFPAAATPADNMGSPDMTRILSYLMGWDGTEWDRLRGDATNGLLVNLGANNDVTVTPAALTMTHTTATATSSSSAMLASNASRKYALLQNIGSVDVDIKIGATAVASQGIRLLANGGSYEMTGANLATGAVNGITATGSATVVVTEGV